VFGAKYREVLAEPDRTERFFLGWPYKYWSHVLFFDPLPLYTQLEIPVLLAHGAQDRSSPIESAYYLREKFMELGKGNLFFFEAADCGHTFVDSKGLSHTGEVFAAIRNWLADH